MRFNEKQLVLVSLNDPDMEDRLNFTVITTNNASFSRERDSNKLLISTSIRLNNVIGFKDRWFRLKYNLLFYFKFLDTGTIDLSEPLGVIVLEGSSVNYETSSGTPFAFSLSFPDQPDKKYVFSAKTEEAVHRWIAALKNARYSELRNHARKLQSAVKQKLGQDPLARHTHLIGAPSVGDSSREAGSSYDINREPEVNLINF